MPPALSLLDVVTHPEDETSDLVKLVTAQGSLVGRLHPADGDAAILWVFGSGGGLGGPAGRVYTRLAGLLQPRGVASLELDYRRPGELGACVQDALLGIAWLETLGKTRTVLVGHSFGGAVVIGAGAVSPTVVAVAALSSQTAGTGAVDALSPRPLLLVHGTADEILPPSCSEDIHARASGPKELILYPGCRHGLDQCREALDRDLLLWLEGVLRPAPPP
ncbi:alpha/beta hydrolase [Rubellimicrobium roseum]|uniref:Alpha/beta hydrolase n=1 Tax=Rubellimicrobium roseum TaxID=687525 RepID=A0A5C4NM43_9RHOB|nr:alpha/beta hydrolase [Rubellimicrobium roseum]TNC74186.1 alpha/beta hydrolase [Rubellimicrobium roseum]